MFKYSLNFILAQSYINPKPCDIWAFGCTVYYLMTGELLFVSKTKNELIEEQKKMYINYLIFLEKLNLKIFHFL